MTGRPRVLVVATRNRGKLAEFAAALGAAGIEVHGLEELPPFPEVEETGSTFEENARLKAEACSRVTAFPVLGDDSGLEVDALDGAPGVRSARYGGPGLDDEGRNRALLAALADVPPARRAARFRCALAFALGGSTLATFEGVVEGVILDTPRGGAGFGYDPLFFHPPTGRGFGELSREEKRRWSHRGQALRAFLQALERGELGAVDDAPTRW